jgi:hypothetical protein
MEASPNRLSASEPRLLVPHGFGDFHASNSTFTAQIEKG